PASSSLSLHDALPISSHPEMTASWTSDPVPNCSAASAMVSSANSAKSVCVVISSPVSTPYQTGPQLAQAGPPTAEAASANARLGDRKSTRLNSSHVSI